MQARIGNTGPASHFITDVTVDFASVGANTTVTQAVTVPGAEVGDLVFAQWASAAINAGLVVACGSRVSAADTVQLVVGNCTAGALDPASATVSFLVFKTANLRLAI